MPHLPPPVIKIYSILLSTGVIVSFIDRMAMNFTVPFSVHVEIFTIIQFQCMYLHIFISRMVDLCPKNGL